MSTTEVIGPHM